MTRQDCAVFRYHDFTGELNALTNDVMNSLKLEESLKHFLILIALTAWLPLSMILSPVCTLCTGLFSLTDTLCSTRHRWHPGTGHRHRPHTDRQVESSLLTEQTPLPAPCTGLAASPGRLYWWSLNRNWEICRGFKLEVMESSTTCICPSTIFHHLVAYVACVQCTSTIMGSVLCLWSAY